MEKLVDKLSINNKPTARDNGPQIRNPNYWGPRQPCPPPLQIAQRGQKLPNDNVNDQARPPFQQNMVDEEFISAVDGEINSVGGEEEKCFLTKR